MSMAGIPYETHDACPRCSSRTISRKKDSEIGRPRVHPDPYTCKRCNAHFENPEEIEVLVTDG